MIHYIAISCCKE